MFLNFKGEFPYIRASPQRYSNVSIRKKDLPYSSRAASARAPQMHAWNQGLATCWQLRDAGWHSHSSLESKACKDGERNPQFHAFPQTDTSTHTTQARLCSSGLGPRGSSPIILLGWDTVVVHGGAGGDHGCHRRMEAHAGWRRVKHWHDARGRWLLLYVEARWAWCYQENHRQCGCWVHLQGKGNISHSSA